MRTMWAYYMMNEMKTLNNESINENMISKFYK